MVEDNPFDTVDIEPAEAPSDGQLVELRDLATSLVSAENHVNQLEAALETAKRDLALLRDDQVPRKLMDLGLPLIGLDDGSQIRLVDDYRCGQLDDGPDRGGRPLADRLKALNWLTEAGHGDLAKRVVTVVLGNDAEPLARRLVEVVREELKKAGKDNSALVDQRSTVVWNTLAKFAREQVEAGEDPPLETLGVQHVKAAKIVRPKKKS